MLVVFYTDVSGTEKLCRDTIELSGAKFVKQVDNEGEVIRSDAIIVLVSFKGDTFNSFISDHPYNKKILVTNTRLVPDNNTILLDSLEDVPQVLSKIIAQENRAARPTMTSSKEQKKRRINAHFNKCVYCNKEIGDTTLGMRSHLIACQSYRNRPLAFGSMTTVRQPNGKTKGSILTIYIPSRLVVNDRTYEAGLHIVTNPKAIKILNAVLRDTYRYTVNTNDVIESGE